MYALVPDALVDRRVQGRRNSEPNAHDTQEVKTCIVVFIWFPPPELAVIEPPGFWNSPGWRKTREGGGAAAPSPEQAVPYPHTRPSPNCLQSQPDPRGMPRAYPIPCGCPMDSELKPYRVLVCDDQPDVLQALRLLLSSGARG